jgi:hypothetical protein
MSRWSVHILGLMNMMSSLGGFENLATLYPHLHVPLFYITQYDTASHSDIFEWHTANTQLVLGSYFAPSCDKADSGFTNRTRDPVLCTYPDKGL